MDCVFAGYDVLESDGVRLRFNIPDPDPGVADTLTIIVSDAQLAAVTTPAQLRTLVTALLNRKVRKSTTVTRLDPFKGMSVTI